MTQPKPDSIAYTEALEAKAAELSALQNSLTVAQDELTLARAEIETKDAELSTLNAELVAVRGERDALAAEKAERDATPPEPVTETAGTETSDAVVASRVAVQMAELGVPPVENLPAESNAPTAQELVALINAERDPKKRAALYRQLFPVNQSK